MKHKTLLCADIGTSKIKIVIKKNNSLIKHTYDRTNDSTLINELCNEHTVNNIILTGCGSTYFKDKLDCTVLNELECIANLIPHLNHQEGLVINIGTGTSFIQYKAKTFHHINGTGIGGGTIIGLSKRLLGTSIPSEIEALALKGQLKEVNLMIEDIYSSGLSWMQKDITISNFGKLGGSDEDVAMGIHSIVAEPILSILKSIITYCDVGTIVYSGGVVQNQVIKNMLTFYSDIFKINYIILDEPSYGTCLGAIALYESTFN